MTSKASLTRCRQCLFSLALLSLFLNTPSVKAAPLFNSPEGKRSEHVLSAGDRQLIHQEQQQQVLEQRLTPEAPDVRLSRPSGFFGRIIFPQETPCFAIPQVTLSGSDTLPHWLPLQRSSAVAIRHSVTASGERMWIRDWIAPFGDTKAMRRLVGKTLFPERCFRALYHRGAEKGLRVINFKGDQVGHQQAIAWRAANPLSVCLPEDSKSP